MNTSRNRESQLFGSGTSPSTPAKRGVTRICVTCESLPFRVFDKIATVAPGAMVESKW
jgi:hypothetical protein